MISHHHKCIFVHIPKNAGQSIEHVFLNLLNLDWETRAPLLLRYNDRAELGPPRLAHLRAQEYVSYRYLSQELFEEYFKFTFVRNPWSRMVSIYKYLKFNQKYEFKSFLKNAFKNKVWRDDYWFVRPQSDFVCTEDGKLLVDFVGKFETLQEDFNDICTKIALAPIKIPHVNKSNVKPKPSLHPIRFIEYVNYQISQINLKQIPTFKKYQDYYDHESIEIVAELYKRDIELFGYKFNN